MGILDCVLPSFSIRIRATEASSQAQWRSPCGVLRGACPGGEESVDVVGNSGDGGVEEVHDINMGHGARSRSVERRDAARAG